MVDEKAACVMRIIPEQRNTLIKRCALQSRRCEWRALGHASKVHLRRDVAPAHWRAYLRQVPAAEVSGCSRRMQPDRHVGRLHTVESRFGEERACRERRRRLLCDIRSALEHRAQQARELRLAVSSTQFFEAPPQTVFAPVDKGGHLLSDSLRRCVMDNKLEGHRDNRHVGAATYGKRILSEVAKG